jgi:hypothetical protein
MELYSIRLHVLPWCGLHVLYFLGVVHRIVRVIVRRCRAIIRRIHRPLRVACVAWTYSSVFEEW